MADSHRDLLAWKKAMELVTDVYECTANFPARETYGLTSQLRRAAVSVPSNIAEGKGRLSKKEYLQYLSRARGSLHEVDTQLEIGCNLTYLPPETLAMIKLKSSETGRLLNGLIRSVRNQIESPES
jgi:four helix bundle protein